MSSNRREFLSRTGCAALSMAALSAGHRKFGLLNLLAQEAVSAPTDYRALVCIFLNGGNDAKNMIIPNDSTRYGQYSAARGSAGLAIPQASLLPINAASAGAFGFHPNLGIGFPTASPYPTLHQLFNAGKLAVVGNVGTLVQPLTKAQYNSGAPRPLQLLSHSDQIGQWLTARPDLKIQNGWGGRLADRVVNLNAGSGFPLVTSVNGTTVFGVGLSTRPLAIGTGNLNTLLVLNGFTTSADDVARRTTYDALRTIDRQAAMIKAAGDVTQQAIDIGGAFSTNPALTTQFPATGIGNQLQQIARIIKLNQTSPALSLNRQIFFAQLGGFDTHQNEIASQNTLFTQLSQAMSSFYQATVELGLETRVTTFTMSDFGRTFAPSGQGAGVVGTDHAWGNDQIVMGGAVLGGNFYGVTNPSSGTPWPVLTLGGPDDIGNRGRFIPTTALDQYAATLANWLGLPPADRSTVFPLIGRFSTPDLGFMI